MTLTPIEVEDNMRGLINKMYEAQKELATARDTETASEIEYKRAKARVYHRGDCPKVTRGGYTVADKDAWIDEQIMNEWVALKVATTAREVAQDNLRILLAIAETWRSLGASVRTAYGVAGAA